MADPVFQCGCKVDKIRAVHEYLAANFPGYAMNDFHAPTRLMQAGLPGPHGEHHVVSLVQDDVLPYYAVLLAEFLELPAAAIAERLRTWGVTDTLRGNRIAVVGKSGASSL